MVDIIISGLDEAETIIDMGYPTHIVSIVDEENNIKHRGDHHLIVSVDDAVFNDSKNMPHMSHLKTVLDFTANLTNNDILLVHCMAGVSRSTAIATAVLIQHGMPYYEALRRAQSIRPILQPNQRFIALIDAYFELKGKYIEHFNEWRRRNINSVTSIPKLVRLGNIDHMKDLLDEIKNKHRI